MEWTPICKVESVVSTSALYILDEGGWAYMILGIHFSVHGTGLRQIEGGIVRIWSSMETVYKAIWFSSGYGWLYSNARKQSYRITVT